jgi:proteasome lid subunit RPN8/RPN11
MKFEDREKTLYVSVSQSVISKITEICQKAYPNETGGILIGHYSANLKGAYVIEATNQTDDSSSGRFWFKRGINGLKKMLISYWSENQYYLGEWHFHPGNSPYPSRADINQMNVISKNRKFNCPEPILVIVGQINTKFVISVQIFIEGKMITLSKTTDE